MNDVKFLHPIYHQLKQLVKKKELWFKDLIDEMVNETIKNNDINHIIQNTWYKLQNLCNTRNSRNILYSLIKWRENFVRSHDVPRNHVCNNNALIHMSHNKMQNIKQVSRVKGMGYVLRNDDVGLKQIVNICQSPSSVRDYSSISEDKKYIVKHKDNYRKLYKLLHQIAIDHKICPFFIVNKDDLVALSNGMVHDRHGNDLRCMKPGWRRDIFGSKCMDIVQRYKHHEIL